MFFCVILHKNPYLTITITGWATDIQPWATAKSNITHGWPGPCENNADARVDADADADADDAIADADDDDADDAEVQFWENRMTVPLNDCWTLLLQLTTTYF